MGTSLAVSEKRTGLLAHLAQRIVALPAATPSRVAVDGVDGAGKTMFADELAAAVRAAGRPVVRASVDGFHHPRAIRHRRGRTSPQGYYADSYDYDELRRALLDPLEPGGSRRVRTAVFDHRTDRAVFRPPEMVPTDGVVVVDGIFLHRSGLCRYWHFSILLDVDVTVSVARCAARDGTPPNVADPANARYVEGQRLYFDDADPRLRASVVVDNTDLAQPFVVAR